MCVCVYSYQLQVSRIVMSSEAASNPILYAAQMTAALTTTSTKTALMIMIISNAAAAAAASHVISHRRTECRETKLAEIFLEGELRSPREAFRGLCLFTDMYLDVGGRRDDNNVMTATATTMTTTTTTLTIAMMISDSVEALACRCTYVNRNNEMLQRDGGNGGGAAAARNPFTTERLRPLVGVRRASTQRL